jgi:uncharacterized membrane protein YeiB
MKFFKKLNEKEKFLNYKSAHNAFLFYAVVGLILSIYSQINPKEAINWQHTVWLCVMVVFMWSRLYYSQKADNEKNK